MQKELTITLTFNNDQMKALENIRWKHIDIDGMIKEALEEASQEIVKDVIEEVCYGIE